MADAPFHDVRFAAIAFTVWASLYGAFDFAITQAAVASLRMRGLNLAILSGSVSCCLLAMASHKSSLTYNAWTNGALTLYILWDILALAYFKSRSPRWYRYYKDLSWSDAIYLVSFTGMAYLPDIYPRLLRLGKALQTYIHSFLPFVGNGSAASIDPHDLESLSDVFTGTFLWLQLVSYVFVVIRRKVAHSDRDQIVDVQDGYTQWCEVYDTHGNAVIDTERVHTQKRLDAFDITGKVIIDLGCGTGFFTRQLLLNASKVIAIDSNSPMLNKLREHYHSSLPANLEIVQGDVFSIPTRSAQDASADGVLCCLVIDHLEDFRLKEMLNEAFRVLKGNGWLYITDVNPYFELLEEPYAKFVGQDGIQQRIKVYPHTVEVVLKSFKDAGFPVPSIGEEKLPQAIAEKWNIENLTNFPLIIEHFASKP